MIRKGQGPHNETLLLVGNGRLSRHFQFYFQSLNLKFQIWTRTSSRNLLEAAADCDRILLAVSDSAIEGLVRELSVLGKPIVHFSGALTVEGALSAHPLMSFGQDLYAADFYPRIHFTVNGALSLIEVLPGLPNSFSPLFSAQKPLYHALCVMGGNFPVMLWNHMETELMKMGVPSEAARLYIQRVAENYLAVGAKALTGPIIRGDEKTISKNLDALKDSPWQHVYESFREAVK